MYLWHVSICIRRPVPMNALVTFYREHWTGDKKRESFSLLLSLTTLVFQDQLTGPLSLEKNNKKKRQGFICCVFTDSKIHVFSLCIFWRCRNSLNKDFCWGPHLPPLSARCFPFAYSASSLPFALCICKTADYLKFHQVSLCIYRFGRLQGSKWKAETWNLWWATTA